MPLKTAGASQALPLIWNNYWELWWINFLRTIAEIELKLIADLLKTHKNLIKKIENLVFWSKNSIDFENMVNKKIQQIKISNNF